jgi:hypothetical protein
LLFQELRFCTHASLVVKGDIIKVTYTKPAFNQLQTASGGKAVSITAQTSKNNVTTVQVTTSPEIIMTINPNPIQGILNNLKTRTVYDGSQVIIKNRAASLQKPSPDLSMYVILAG